MTLLELVILAHRCRSTHHYIAFDALQLLSGPDAPAWKKLLLRHHEDLFEGAKAPDTRFKDYKNHVLHVQEGEWGGARDAAMEWYGKAVNSLRQKKWSQAAYALGVLSHYYADPVHPFHTAQSEEESTIHRALEWSVYKSRDTIKALIDLRGYPQVPAGKDTGFVADMVLAGAQFSNPHYTTLIDHYNLEAGVKDPRAGLDQKLLDVFADLIAYATAGVAVLFERALAEARIAPPEVDLDLSGYLAALDIPIRKLTRRLQDKADRRQVEAMYRELQSTGKVLRTLPADDRTVRRLHAEQVLRRPVGEIDQYALEPIGEKHVPLAAQPEPVRYVLKVVAEPTGAAPVAPAPEPEAPDPHLFDQDETETPEEAAPAAATAEADNQTEDDPVETTEAVTEADAAKVAAEPQAEAEPDTGTGPEAALADAQEEPAVESLAAEEAEAGRVAAEKAEKEAPAPAETPSAGDKSATRADTSKATNESASKPAQKQKDKDKLTPASDVVDAPSIGPKTAARLADVSIHTIDDLLSADPEETAAALNVRYINADTIRDWQDQTRLMMDAPGLRVLDSQILVGAGIRSAEDLASATAGSVLKAATNFLDTPGGARVLWGADNTVGEDEVKHWIDCAKSVRT